MTIALTRHFSIALFAVLVGLGLVASADDKPLAKWEYRVVTKDQVAEIGKNDLAAGLNKLGSEGWELVVVDGGYIFKRPKLQNDRDIADLKLKIAILNRDIEMQKERVAWSNRMLKMGYMSNQAAAAEQERLERFELVLEKMTKDLDKLTVPPIEPIPLAPLPKERKADK
jgi:hypothetical protein